MNIFDLIKSRRTIRKFLQKLLSENQLMSYIDAARVAPSGANLQPLKYIAVQSMDMAEKVFPLLKWAGYLEDYAPKEGERPVAYIVVCVDKDIRPNGGELDVGASVENILLAALSEGVGTCWLASVDRDALADLLDIPDNLYISSVVALGYPAETPKEVELNEDKDIKYYLDGMTLCVPKRSMDDIVVKMF